MSGKSSDRRQGETNKAWAAFCVYRDIGLNRTYEKVCEKIYAADDGQNPARNVSQVRAWSKANDWIERCRDYDADRELAERAIRAEFDRDGYIKDLEKYKLQQKAIGTAAMNFTARSLTAIDHALSDIHEAVKTKRPLTGKQIYTLFSAQLAGKNAMAISTAGDEMAARGLAVEELMKQVEHEINSLQS